MHTHAIDLNQKQRAQNDSVGATHSYADTSDLEECFSLLM